MRLLYYRGLCWKIERRGRGIKGMFRECDKGGWLRICMCIEVVCVCGLDLWGSCYCCYLDIYS